jgi:hypothetical protein
MVRGPTIVVAGWLDGFLSAAPAAQPRECRESRECALCSGTFPRATSPICFGMPLGTLVVVNRAAVPFNCSARDSRSQSATRSDSRAFAAFAASRKPSKRPDRLASDAIGPSNSRKRAKRSRPARSTSCRGTAGRAPTRQKGVAHPATIGRRKRAAPSQPADNQATP